MVCMQTDLRVVVVDIYVSTTDYKYAGEKTTKIPQLQFLTFRLKPSIIRLYLEELMI